MDWFDERKLLQAISEDWEKAILAQGKPFLRVLTLSAVKAGFPPASLQYLYFVLYERMKDWNVNPDEKISLSIGRDITLAAAVSPAYSKSGIRLPDADGENALDKAFRDTAKWERTDMAPALSAALEKSAAIHGHVVEKTHPEIPPGTGASYLIAQFRETMEKAPRGFHLGQLMGRTLGHFFV